MTSVESILDTLTHSSWFGDMDSAEILNNYKLSEKDQSYAGVDVSWAEKEKGSEVGKMEQDGHGTAPLPICNDKDVCLGDGGHNW